MEETMKEINELNLPEDISYTSDHEWVCREGDTVKIGISDYAQDQLGDIVFVEMPEVGDSFKQGDEFGTLESVKAVSEIYLPVSGKIISVNSALEDAPEMVNEDPYANWIVEVKPDDQREFEALLSREGYLAVLHG